MERTRLEWSAYLKVYQSQNKTAQAAPVRNAACHKYQSDLIAGFSRFASVSNLPVLHCGFRRR
jgi:hypothetical protein